MNRFPYPKGSVWRRWDLQIQTILDDGYVSLDRYCQELVIANPDAWQRYVTKIGGKDNALLYDSKDYFNDNSKPKKERCFNYARNFFAFLEEFCPALQCIGITDHNYLDELLLDTLIDGAKEAPCKIIPGVEINCQGIHMLLFFPEKLYQKTTFSAGIHFFLSKFNINTRTNPAGALATTSCDIKEILNEVKANGGIVIYPHCNSNNGLFQERTKTDRTHLSDIFNHQKVNLLQSQHHESSIAVAEYIKSNLALVSKSCCHISSDARSLRDYGRADKEGNYLWVKADPGFEGFKQILFEPEQRVFVGPQKPEEKKSYFVIENVCFLDNAAQVRFGSEPIEINQNLTAIIGGKSTGKSLLLYYMAKTIDRNEVENRLASGVLPGRYDLDASTDFNFEVSWRDGQKTLLKAPAGADANQLKERKILYIPQKYLNSLSEGNARTRETLNEFVLQVILQEPNTNEAYYRIFREIETITKSISAAIITLFSDRDEMGRSEEELKKAGDEKGVETYIKTLQKDVDEIKGRSGLSPEELKQHEDFVATEKRIATHISFLEDDRKTLEKFQTSVEVQVSALNATAQEYQTYFHNPDILAKFKAEFQILESLRADVATAATNVAGGIETEITREKSELLRTKTELAPLLAKVQMQSELRQKVDSITVEQQKLNQISVRRNNLTSKQAAFRKKIESILDSYKQMIGKYETLRDEFKKFEAKFGEITLGIHMAFDDGKFNLEVVDEFLNKNDLKRIFTEKEWSEEFVYQYDPAKHFAKIVGIFEGLLDGTINTVKNRKSQDALAKLLRNYFHIDFRIFYKNDYLDKMSPGKKGLVLLQLLINLSNEEWPILLDQPEDDLDNRSVYEDLVAFLKEKKIRRQIIIVTHNPNLVVGADAEETIVANQSGQEIGRDNLIYRFEYVSGGLENAFEIDAEKEAAILLRKGIRQHVCEILEGGKEAFQKREQKYDFSELS